MNFLRHVRHRIAHRFGWTHGKVESRKIDGIWYIGFRCAICGEFQDPIRSHHQDD